VQNLVLLSLAGVKILPVLGMDEPYIYLAEIKTLFVDADLQLIDVCDICADLFPSVVAMEADASRLCP
jgi:hypothetical protein